MVGPFGFHPNKTMRSRALQLAKPLAGRGHEVKIIMPPWQTPEEANREWVEDGVQIRYTSLKGGVLGTSRALIRDTLAWKPDVIHAFKPKAYSGIAAWWLWTFHRRQLRLIVDSDDWEGWGGWNEIAPYTATQKRFFAWQERWGLAHNHALTVASRTLQSLAWASGLQMEKVFYLPNGPGIGQDISLSDQTRADLGLSHRPVLLLYSRLFEFNTDRLVTILEGVKAVIPNLAILSVGAGLLAEDAATLRDRLLASGLQDQIVDVGWIEETELPQYLAAADVGLYLMDDTLLNRTKCPVKLADMASIGLPVVAENVGQVGEYVIHEQTGLLRSPGDVDAVTADIVHLFQADSERRRLGEGAKEHLASHFNWEHLATVAERAYLG
jgi:glycosyltransferase involved in cell wall biosynthesis